MFGKSKETRPMSGDSTINLIGGNTEIVGDISSTGDIRIDGKLKGNVNTSAKLVLGPTGIITGNVSCANGDISGKIEGMVNVSELLTLKSSAKINGDIKTNKFLVESGAVFVGKCDMSSVETVSKAGDKK